MPPPVNRRTGASRRAQFSVFIGYVVGAVGVLIGAGLLVLHAGDSVLAGRLRGLAGDGAAPAGHVAAAARDGIGQSYAAVSGYIAAGAQNARLQREVALARVRLVQAAAIIQENERLRAQLHLAQGAAPAVANAWLIASTNSSTRRYATISAGSGDGVRGDMPVVSALGLVGRVLETGRHSARVLLITDSESVVPVRRVRDGLPAFATGRADGLLQLRLLSLGLNPLKRGDAFVTSGSGGLYWPNTPIAVVDALTRDGAVARVLASPAASEFVTVQPVWNPAADPTLPPPAAPDQRAKGAKGRK